MTPDQLSAIASFVNIISRMSGWPLGAIVFFAVLGPWLAAFFLVYLQGKRFERVVKMYEDNVILVEDYSKLATDLHDVVIMNTQAMTRLLESIRTNQYCPAIRLEKKANGVQV